jgi:phage-related protein (TIGR01555 family)
MPSAAPKPKTKSRVSVPDTMTAGLPKQKLIGPVIDANTLFTPTIPAPGVIPKGRKMAMDAIPPDLMSWMAGAAYNLAFVEGYTFLGYPYLSQLANIPEFRLIGETIATEATRKWIEIKSKSEDKGKADEIAALEEEFDRLGVRAAFKTISEQDSWFGRAHLYVDTGDTDDRPELVKPLGDGGKLTERKLRKGDLRALKTVEPVWCYPSRYDAADPLKDNWYRPDVWFVNGKEVHSSRLLTFVGRPVPDLLKPAFSFGGLSLTQMAKPYVDNWLQTRQSVNDLIQAFSVMVLSTDLSGLLQEGGAELEKRIQLFNNYRNNRGVMVLSKEDEEFTNVTAQLSGLDKLQAQAQEHMASVSQIPLVKLLGISPSGLNASSEGEIRVFYDREHAYQEFFFTPHLTTIFKMAQINLWGKVDPDLTFIYKPLWELDEAELATVRKTNAETDALLIDKGVLDPVESRRRLAGEPDQSYGELDPDDVPETDEPLPENINQTDRLEDRDDEDLPQELEPAAA